MAIINKLGQGSTMTIYNKPDTQIFAKDAKQGEITSFPDILRGWGITIDTTNGIPPMEFFNALQNRTDEALAYLMQRGVAEWREDLEYPKHAITILHGQVFFALQQNANKNPLSNPEVWVNSFAQKANVSDVYSKQEVTRCVDTIADLKKLILKENDVVEVIGYSDKDDGATHKRVIKSENDGTGIAINGGQWANLLRAGEVKVEWFGAKGDGITDDSNAIQGAINTNLTVCLSNKLYVVNQPIVLKENQTIVGNGAVLTSSSDINILTASGGNTIQNVYFMNEKRVATAINLVGSLNNFVSKIRVNNFKNGILLGDSVEDHRGNQISDVFATNCTTAFNVGNRGEYTTFTNCTATQNDIALLVIGGNTHFVGGNLCNNKIGVKIARGANDAHGLVSSTSIKHNTDYAIYVDSPSVNEFLFDNISLYYGNIYLKNCQKIRILNSTIDTCTVTEDNAVDCTFKNIGYLKNELVNIPNHNNSASFVRYENVDSKKGGASNENSVGGTLYCVNDIALTIKANTEQELTFDTVIYNSINRNINYKYTNFLSSDQKTLTLTNTISNGWICNIAAEINLYNLNESDASKIEVFVEREGSVKGNLYFKYAGTRSVGKFTVTRFTLNEALVKGNCKIKIVNNTSQSVAVARHQESSGLLNFVRVYNI